MPLIRTLYAVLRMSGIETSLYNYVPLIRTLYAVLRMSGIEASLHTVCAFNQDTLCCPEDVQNRGFTIYMYMYVPLKLTCLCRGFCLEWALTGGGLTFKF